MWDWMQSLFGKQEVAPVQTEPESQESPVPDKLLIMDDLKIAFKAHAKEIAMEQAKREAELLASSKLKTYVQNALTYMDKDLRKGDQFDFILVRASNCQVSGEFWTAFKSGILMPLLKEFEIKASDLGEYIRVEKEPLRQALRGLVNTQDVMDESMRELLRQGPYR
jgi:hypothetical protein